mgnify:CR=1 FL=1
MLMIQRWIGIGILSLLTLPLMAQKGLQVNTLFDGRFKKRSQSRRSAYQRKGVEEISPEPVQKPYGDQCSGRFPGNGNAGLSGCKKCRGQGSRYNREPSVLWLLLFFGRRRNFQIPLLPQHFRKARKRKAAGGYGRLHGGASHPRRTQTIISIRITINTDSI